jgi:hypothetical protein
MGFQIRMCRSLALLLLGIVCIFTGASALADGCFVFRWNKQKDINEPTQKAIILHESGQEDLVLQVKYEGPAEDFGWLIPVPAKPEVRKGSMEPFYELSRLTQKQFREGQMYERMASARGGDEKDEVKVVEIKTVGSYEVAILSGSNSSALADWLTAHEFHFPKEKQAVLDQYIQRKWFFVAARINPEGNDFVVKTAVKPPDKISASTRDKLAKGELHPIIISFASEKCVFPLAISSINGVASEVSLYVLSPEPLLSNVIYGRKETVYKTEKDKWVAAGAERENTRERFEAETAKMLRESRTGGRLAKEDPADPPPESVFDRPNGESEWKVLEDPDLDFYSPTLQPVRSMAVEGQAHEVKGLRHDLPRVRAKRWWLTKVVELFQPQDMADLEFEAAIPFLTARMLRENGEAAAHALPQYESLAVPAILATFKDSNAVVRKRAALAASETVDGRLIDPVLTLMEDKDAGVRKYACYAAAANWDQRFAEPLFRLNGDSDPGVVSTARYCIERHLKEVNVDTARLRQIASEDGPASLVALQVLEIRHEVTHEDLVQFLGSTNLPTLSMAFTPIRYELKVEELDRLITNSLPSARLMAVGVLARIAEKAAVDRLVSMLRDPNEGVRWRVRSAFRRLTGQKLGAEPAAYEKWWAENKESYVRKPQGLDPGRR